MKNWVPERDGVIRPASLPDLDTLLALEHRSFRGDRLSRRSLRHLLTRGHAEALVDAGADGAIRGYVLVLYRTGSTHARLYSIAVASGYRRQGVAAALVRAAERRARAANRSTVRLEVRRDNAASLALFRNQGYREFGTRRCYYEDGMDAVRLEKALTGPPGGR